jgi:hypothetical protein
VNISDGLLIADAEIESNTSSYVFVVLEESIFSKIFCILELDKIANNHNFVFILKKSPLMVKKNCSEVINLA